MRYNLKLLPNLLTSIIIAVAWVLLGLAAGNSQDGINSSVSRNSPREVCMITGNKITEASGIAASRTKRDCFWIHNDSGAGPVLYLVDMTVC